MASQLDLDLSRGPDDSVLQRMVGIATYLGLGLDANL